jgi:hypothetical protein
MNRFRNNRFNSNTTGINEDLKIEITKKLNEFINDETKRGIHSMLLTLKLFIKLIIFFVNLFK